MRPALGMALGLLASACAALPGAGVELGPDGRPHPAVARVTLFRCAFWRAPCDAGLRRTSD